MTPNDSPSGDGIAAAVTEAQPAATVMASERAKLLGLIGLPETATDAEVEGLIADLRAKAGETATVQSDLAGLVAERDALRAQYDELFARQTELDKRQREAEATAALEPLKGLIAEEQLGKLRELYLSNPEAAKFSMELLQEAAKMKAGTDAEAAKAGAKGTPPGATHKPGEEISVVKTAEQKAAEGEVLITAIRKEGKFTDYSAAREEARRRSPELFQ